MVSCWFSTIYIIVFVSRKGQGIILNFVLYYDEK
jgi:hypothetical protein